MPYPFPGMNPWLESRQLWRGVHTSLITAMRDWLAPQVEPRYFVDIETHTYCYTNAWKPDNNALPGRCYR